MTTTCQNCERELVEGESAYADDWKVWDVYFAEWRTEVRYTCDDCAAMTA